MKKKLEVLDSLRDSLDRTEMMIVGSLALYLNGFDVAVNDVDLEMITPTSDVAQKLVLLIESTPVELRCKNYPTENVKRYDFMYQGVKFNIWVKDKFSHPRFTYFNYYKVAGVLSVLQYMKQFGRVKDFQQILRIVAQVINFDVVVANDAKPLTNK